MKVITWMTTRTTKGILLSWVRERSDVDDNKFSHGPDDDDDDDDDDNSNNNHDVDDIDQGPL